MRAKKILLEAASIINSIRLQIRPRVRDSNPGQRGVANPTVHQTNHEQFDGYCFNLMWKTQHHKGCKIRPDLDLPAEIVFLRAADCEPRHALRERSRLDSLWLKNVSDHVHNFFGDYFADMQTTFDEDFLIFMAERGIYRQQNQLGLTMTRDNRDRMNRGQVETFHTPVRGAPTPPLRQHPGYSTLPTGTAWAGVPKPPPPVKGKGSGKGKGKGKRKW